MVWSSHTVQYGRLDPGQGEGELTSFTLLRLDDDKASRFALLVALRHLHTTSNVACYVYLKWISCLSDVEVWPCLSLTGFHSYPAWRQKTQGLSAAMSHILWNEIGLNATSSRRVNCVSCNLTLYGAWPIQKICMHCYCRNEVCQSILWELCISLNNRWRINHAVKIHELPPMCVILI